MKTILLKIDEDNDIFEMRINDEVYTLDNVYESKYSKLFDELNMAIDIHKIKNDSDWSIDFGKYTIKEIHKMISDGTITNQEVIEFYNNEWWDEEN